MTHITDDGAHSEPIGRGDHILMVAGHFAPESASGTHRSLHFARALRDAGFSTSVVTLDEASLQYIDRNLNSIFPFEDSILRVARGPTFSTLYLSVKNVWRSVRNWNDSHAAIHSNLAARNETPRLEKQRHTLRHELSGLVSYPDKFQGWRGPALRAALVLAQTKPIKVVFASGPPWTGLLIAHDLSRRLRCKLIVDFRDPWTPSMGSVPVEEPRLYRALAKRDEAAIVKVASLVLVNSPEMMSNALENGALPVARIRCLINGTNIPARTEQRSFTPDGRLILRHFGSLYGGRSIEPLIDALMRSDGIDATRIGVELVGANPAEAEPGLSKGLAAGMSIKCLPSVPYSEATHLMAAPAILLAVQGSDFAAQIPTKLYEYLRTGNPLLVLTPAESATWQLASRFERCHRIDFSDAEGNRATLARLYEQWAQGRLLQVRADSDTAYLSKSVIGSEFAKLVRCVLDDTL